MKPQGLYDPKFEHDSCGVGFVVNVNGERTHQVVADGITVLKNLMHRGAVGGDLKSGDGAGLLCQIPHALFSEVCNDRGFGLPGAGGYGVGMLFLPRDAEKRRAAKHIVEEALGKGLIGWRDVPVDPLCLGEMATASMPRVAQVFVAIEGLAGSELERRLYILRKGIEKAAGLAGLTTDDFYVVSLSSRTITYKGMFFAPHLEQFYADLRDRRFTSAIALIHQRYSTNTFPSWALAQPFRWIAHNGEINTVRGNVNKMAARESLLRSDLFGDEIEKLQPVITPGLSDSGMFDNVLELLVEAGRPIEHAMMMMVPEAFGPKYHISQDKRAFYEYHAAIMEPWDGPAAIAFTDGVKVGALLDRNGLRPARYLVTKSGRVVLASEAGVLPIAAKDVLQQGRLGPGRMLLVNTATGRIIHDNEIKAAVSRSKPYRRWLESNRIELRGLVGEPGDLRGGRDTLAQRQRLFGYTVEDLKMTIGPMAENAQEPLGSMGNDQALAVLSDRPQLLFNYFKQLFAQVTNPPIDPYRENQVMSLMSFVGQERNLLEETAAHCRQLKLPHPFLSNDDLEKLRKVVSDDVRPGATPMLFNVNARAGALAAALDELCARVEGLVDSGCNVVIVSDRAADAAHAPIPVLLACSAVHHHLVRHKKRQQTALVIETGEAREVHHLAALIGYGASAVNPYLVFETIAWLYDAGKLNAGLKLETAIENYVGAAKKGLLKVMSKMGVSTIRSYRGAQIFEAVGLASELVERWFPGTPSRIGGIRLNVVEQEARAWHRAAYLETAEPPALDSGGAIYLRKSGDKHLLTPEAISLLQRAVRLDSYETYQRYAATINDFSRNLCTLRGLLAFQAAEPVPLDQVEPVESIVKRFVSSAMSLGSISKEAHETIAIAMNRLGAASNSGEGGEDEARYTPAKGGDNLNSMVKQVASGRFGVTIAYLISAQELQIKIAQGAKPGEGGQLPAYKVDPFIARVRHSTPYVGLISPPPHHDIYSIEDLAQLIYDLKSANRTARISVKLVAEVGVGTVAAGVAKGKADMVLISGHDGGTGSSPISSIKHAGIPWEIGLAETQQTLVLNRLRDRIRVQVDGQIKTGRDVVVAALLGAEEFGFGTMTLVSLGCIMMRKCHLNTCPVGVATQDPELRKRFQGKPEHLMNFMRFVARDVREIMASLGFRTFDEMVGRVDRLEMHPALDHFKARGVDLSAVLKAPQYNGYPRRCVRTQEHDFTQAIDDELIEQARPALEQNKAVSLFAAIRNSNRAVGATLSAEIAKRYGSKGLAPNTILCRFTGSAGQSFGAFLAPGVTFELEGEANDYLGKGLSGGRIVAYPPKDATFRAEQNVISGNVNLFGATGGEVFLRGSAGERFAVRNSGAVAVVEGVGDHGCEYMTGGCVVVLGPTGVNFAAGMSGGIAYILDENQLFDTRCNLESVDVEPVATAEDREQLRRLVQEHERLTGSESAAGILRDWDEMVSKFVKVMPIDYRAALARIKVQEYKDAEFVAMTEEVYR
jgi:glutamate synthase domain-containing protein 2/glutamate synthase domain-containing protein 1/glutamate synthase domain-containing protein 3